MFASSPALLERSWERSHCTPLLHHVQAQSSLAAHTSILVQLLSWVIHIAAWGPTSPCGGLTSWYEGPTSLRGTTKALESSSLLVQHQLQHLLHSLRLSNLVPGPAGRRVEGKWYTWTSQGVGEGACERPRATNRQAEASEKGAISYKLVL